MTWIMCNLSFSDYRSLLCLIGSLLIKYSFVAPLGHLILHQNFLNVHFFTLIQVFTFTCTLHLFHNLNIYIYIYLSDYQVSSNNWQTIITSVGYTYCIKQLNKIIKSFAGQPSSVTIVPKWFSSVNQVKLGKHCKTCKNPLETEWSSVSTDLWRPSEAR